MSATKIAGIVLDIAGVAALVGVGTRGGSPRLLLAMLGCLAAALSYDVANVFGRRFKLMGVPPTVGAFGQLADTALMVAPAALVFHQPWQLPPPSNAGDGVFHMALSPEWRTRVPFLGKPVSSMILVRRQLATRSRWIAAGQSVAS